MKLRSSILLTLVILLTAGIVTGGGLAYADGTGKDDKAQMAAAAKVTIEQAIKTATDKVSGKVVEAELEKKHDKLAWEVEVVTADNKVMEVHIDATTGAVINVEEEGKD
ncbi:MAG: PepSY domain-containing protein [Nitrospira sp.]|nr:PepSY domain-containing protein [Nitrospira sp.]